MGKGDSDKLGANNKISILVILTLVVGSLVLSIKHIEPVATAEFSTPNVLVDDSPADTYLPSIAVDGKGTLHAVWLDHRNVDSDVYYSNSVDSGASWSPSVRVDDAPPTMYATASSIAVDNSGGPLDGNIYVAFSDPRYGGTHIFVSSSTDGGNTWNADVQVDNAPFDAKCHDVSIAVDDGGIVYTTWMDLNGMTGHIFFSRSNDGGNTWSLDAQISTSNALAKIGPEIATYGKGTVYITWEEINGGHVIFCARSTDMGDTWLQYVVYMAALDTMAIGHDMTVDHDENVLVTFTKAILSETSIYFTSSSSKGSTWTTPVRVDDDTNSSHQGFPRIGVNGLGIYVVWEDCRNGDVDIYFSESKDGGTTWGDGLLNNNDTRVDDTDINADPDDDATYQQTPEITVNEWGVYVIWSDHRSLKNIDVYFACYIKSALVITEFQDSPNGNELIEIYNFGYQEIDLTGYYLTIDGVPLDLTPLGILPSGEYRSIGDPPTANLQVSITLGNEGGIISLYNDKNELLDVVGYGQKGVAPDPLEGESTARYRKGLTYSYEWTRDPTPTFGDGSPPWLDEQNDVPPINHAPEVVLNEIFFNPVVTTDMFVELYYLGSGNLDITDYKIVCDSEYSIGVVMLDSTYRHYFLRHWMAPSFFANMTVEGDNVYLYDSNGRLLDMAGWSSAHAKNLTMSRIPEGNGTYDGYDNPSSEAAGWKFDQPPTLAILEIGPSPQSKYADPGQDVFYNLTVTNKQYTADTIDITNSTPDAGWQVAFFDASGMNLLADTNGNGIPDTGFLGPGMSVDIKARITVPSTFPIANTETIVVYGTVSSDPLGCDNAVLITKVFPRLEPFKVADPTTIFVESAGALGYNNITTITLEVLGAGNAILGGIAPADVLFVIDDTGSMGNEIEAVKRHVNNITNRLTENVTDIRFGLVTYKDVPEMDLDLTYDILAFRAAIMALDASGGGDYPEDVEGAIALGRSASWRTGNDVTRIMIVIGDAPPHNIILACLNAQAAFVEDGIITNTIATDDGADMPEAFQYIAENGSGIFRYIPEGNPADPHEFPSAIINGILAHIPPITVAGYDPNITDNIPMINEVLPSYIHYVDGTFKDPTTGLPKDPHHIFHNPTNTTLQWEVGRILINETWSVSFNATSSKPGWVPVGVYPDAKVTYAKWNGTETISPFPEVFIHVLEPLLYPPYINGIQAVGGIVNITWDLSPSLGVNLYEVYGGPDQVSMDFDPASLIYQSPNESAPANQWWAEFPFDTIANPEYYFVVRAVNSTAPVSRSSTSNTAGYYTISFETGLNTFSLPLKPFASKTLDWFVSSIPSATSISWLDDNDDWQTYPSTLAPLAELGKGYVLEGATNTSYIFTGEPAAMIMYNDEYGWDFDATATVDATLVGDDIELSWPDLGPGVEYYVYWSGTRDGFFLWSYSVLNGGMPITGTIYTDVGAASLPGENYYMIVPHSTVLGVNGSSTYSIGVMTVEYNGNDMLGLPLKPVWGDKSADWYVDQIPYALGVSYLEDGVWMAHFKTFPEGVYDTIIEVGRGYELTVYRTAIYPYVGY